MQDPNFPYQREALIIKDDIATLLPRVKELLKRCERSRNQQHAEACDNAWGALDSARDFLTTFE